MSTTIGERARNEQRSIERDRDAIGVWHSELEENLIGSPTDPELWPRAKSWRSCWSWSNAPASRPEASVGGSVSRDTGAHSLERADAGPDGVESPARAVAPRALELALPTERGRRGAAYSIRPALSR